MRRLTPLAALALIALSASGAAQAQQRPSPTPPQGPPQVVLSATSYVVLSECRVMMTADNLTGGRLRSLVVVADVIANRLSYAVQFTFPLLGNGLLQTSEVYIPLPACTVPLRIEVARAGTCWIDADKIDECTGLLRAGRSAGNPSRGVRPVNVGLPASAPLPRRHPAPAD